MTLAVLFVLAELADLATYLQAPHLESNPAMQGWPPAVVLAKFVGLTAVAALALIGLHGRKQTFTLGVCLAIAAFSFGTNAHALTYVNAAEASRPATQPAPAPSASAGNEQGMTAPAAVSRTPAPGGLGARRAPVVPRGTASWYAVSGDVAAAGPALRRALGDWRGALVEVCAGRCVTVKLVDFCQCYKGQRGERLLDLSDSAFAQLAPLAVGILHVRVSAIVPPATDR